MNTNGNTNTNINAKLNANTNTNIDTNALDTLRLKILEAVELTATAPADQLPAAHKQAIEDVIELIDHGKLRVATPEGDKWSTTVWAKEAILLYFKLRLVHEISCDPLTWIDKIPIKRWTSSMGVRVVPNAVVRYGAHVAKGCVLMPSYINIGAFVDEGTMVDTWATVGSCAQIGKNVHLSGGVGIGGVLEPAQAQPVVIEDNCFVGSRVIVVEGVRVCKGAVLGAGVVLTASTPIVDVRSEQVKIQKGLVPENCVVIPGTLPKKFAAGTYNVPCALIIGQRSAATDKKTSLTQALREFEVPV